MKTLLITLATAATLFAGAASAASTSSAGGDVRIFNPAKQTVFGGSTLDREPTASIGNHLSSGQIFTSVETINGREARVRYTIKDGRKQIISKSFRSSNR